MIILGITLIIYSIFMLSIVIYLKKQNKCQKFHKKRYRILKSRKGTICLACYHYVNNYCFFIEPIIAIYRQNKILVGKRRNK